MTYYVALQIGCLECGMPSDVLGIFTAETKAKDWIGQYEKGETYEDFRVVAVEQLDVPKPYVRS